MAYSDIMCEILLLWIIMFFSISILFWLINNIVKAVKQYREKEEEKASIYIESYVQYRIHQYNRMNNERRY